MDAIGLEVAKTRVDVFDPKPNAHRTFEPDERGLDALTAWLGRRPLVVMEASGGLERRLQDRFARRGLEVAVVNAGRVREFAKAAGKLAKTDRLDAEPIARFALWAKPAPTPPPSTARRKLLDLLAYRRQLLAELTARRQQAEQFTDPDLRRRANERLDALAAERGEIETLMRRTIAADAELERAFGLLTSVPRVGLVLAATVLAQLPELGTLDRRQIASLVGLAPRANDSGLQHGRRRIRSGRQDVRTALDMPAIGQFARDNPFGNAARHLKAQGKPAKVVVVAVMRRMLVVLNAVLKTGVPWQKHTAPA